MENERNTFEYLFMSYKIDVQNIIVNRYTLTQHLNERIEKEIPPWWE